MSKTTSKQLYLVTVKRQGETHKTAYKSLENALHFFMVAYHSKEKDGYQCVTQAMYDDEIYIKVAKCTKGDDVFRMRIENIGYDDED